jgi:hypothetical protein
MGLGLEMWSLPIWGTYCILMVVAEAIFIGRRLDLSWVSSFGISFGANFVTGWGCAVGGCCAPGLHQGLIGGRYDPNPLLNTIFLLVIFAIPSAILEAVIWLWAPRAQAPMSDRAVVWRSIKVHLACVPFGLAILLIPARPLSGAGGVHRVLPSI